VSFFAVERQGEFFTEKFPIISGDNLHENREDEDLMGI
jgi:hypothetical protein